MDNKENLPLIKNRARNAKSAKTSPPIKDPPDIPRTSLLRLDDVVLLQIMKHLHIVDLTHLIETCKRMERLVNWHVARYYENVHWRDYRAPQGSMVKPSESERIFKHIGKHIRKVKLSLWADFEFYEILVILAQECPHVNALGLDSIRMSRPLILCDPLIMQMFGKLKYFELSGCAWQLEGWCPLDLFFGNNKTLEDLTVINCSAYNRVDYRLHMAGFRSLKKLKLIRCRNVVTENELVVCFDNNNINSIVLQDIGNVNIMLDNVMRRLSGTIDDLSIDLYRDHNFIQLARLKRLKVLQLRCNVYCNLDKLLTDFGPDNQIEELAIVKVCISSQTIDALKQFTKLLRLRLDHIVNSIPRQFFRSVPKVMPQLQHFVYAYSTIRDEDVVHMFKFMPKLTRLNFFGCNSLATKTYLQMIEILENDWHRPNVELTPPRWESTKSLEEVKKIQKKLWVRTETIMLNPGST